MKKIITAEEIERFNIRKTDYNSDMASFLDRFSKEELEEMEKPYWSTHRLTTFDNPVSWPIREGLTRTYPIGKTIQYVRDFFNLDGRQIGKETMHNGIEHIFVRIPIISNNMEVIDRAMDMCGYYRSNANADDGNKWVVLQYEAKFIKDDTYKIRNEEETLIHLTPNYNRQKILNIGFSPRCRNSLFKYPNRTYFMRGSIDYGEILNIGQTLCDNNYSLGNNGKYTLFRLPLDRIPEKVRFFLDANYPYGIYTTDYIEKNCIADVMDIEFDL